MGAAVCAVAAGVLALVLFRGVADPLDRRRRGAPVRGLTPGARPTR